MPFVSAINEAGPDTEECSVCCENFAKKDFFALKCGHRFCVNCTVEHAQVNILKKEPQITCLQD